MGKVRGKSIKRAARTVVELYFSRLNKDFENNLSVVRDVIITPNRKTRNQIAGYATHIYKRVKNGDVKGIYIRSHEQEKEKRENLIPRVGVMDSEKIMVDPVTNSMIKRYNIQGNYVVFGSEHSN